MMLEERKDIEAVMAAAPGHTHAPITLGAVRAGKHVDVEKPAAHIGDEMDLTDNGISFVGNESTMICGGWSGAHQLHHRFTSSRLTHKNPLEPERELPPFHHGR